MPGKDFPDEADPLAQASRTPAPLERMLDGLNNRERSAIISGVMEKAREAARVAAGVRTPTIETVWELLDGAKRSDFLETLRAETSIQHQMYQADVNASRRALDYLTGPAVIPIEGMEVAQARQMVHLAVRGATEYLRDEIGIEEGNLDTDCRDILHSEVTARVLAAQQTTQAELDERLAALSGEGLKATPRAGPGGTQSGPHP